MRSWPHDLDDDEILARLLALDQQAHEERKGSEIENGLWDAADELEVKALDHERHEMKRKTRKGGRAFGTWSCCRALGVSARSKE